MDEEWRDIKGKSEYCGKNKNNEPLIWKYIEEV